MPRLNSAAHALMGVGDGIPSLNGQPLGSGIIGGAVQWLTESQPIAQILWADGYALSVWNGAVWQKILGTPGANILEAGGGRWQAWLGGAFARCYGALGDISGAGLAGQPSASNTGVGSAGRDGTLGIIPDCQSGIGFQLHAPDGTVTHYTLGFCDNLQILGPQTALWTEGGQPRTLNYPVPVACGPVTLPRRAVVASEDWLVYWTEPWGLVAHPWTDPRHGIVIEPTPHAFNHDAVGIGAELVVAFAWTSAEAPGDLRVRRYTKADATVDLTEVPEPEPQPPQPEPPDPGPTPIPPTPIPPKPEPPIQVPPPTPFPPARPQGVAMEPFAAAVKMGSYFARVDPTPGQAPWEGWFLVHFDQLDSSDPHCQFAVSQPEAGNPRLQFVNRAIVGILSADAGIHGGGVCKQYYLKPGTGMEFWGQNEQFSGWTLGANGPQVGLVLYPNGEVSASVQVVKL